MENKQVVQQEIAARAQQIDTVRKQARQNILRGMVGLPLRPIHTPPAPWQMR